jgi:formate hydrogenlyase subunit 4
MDLIKRVWELPLRSEPWRAGYIWLILNIISSLLPLWGTILLLLLFSKDISLYGMLKNGEFVLYSAAFTGGALYVIRRDIFISRSISTALLVSFLLVSSVIFVAITASSVNDQSGFPRINESVLTYSSVIVFASTIIFCFFITVADAAGFGLDIPEALKKDEKKLGVDFARLLLKAGQKGDGHE